MPDTVAAVTEPHFTPGPYTIEYHAYPCPKDGHGEPNPPAAFILPPGSDEAIALVSGQGDDPFDSPSQRANAALFAAAPNLLAAAKAALGPLELYHAYGWPDRAGVIGQLKRAIAEATGE